LVVGRSPWQVLGGFPSNSELTQVVVEVFVHARRPLFRRQRTEERMRVPGALRFPSYVKLADTIFELFVLPREISLVGNHEALVGGAVLGERLVIGKYGPDKGSEDAADNIRGKTTRPEATSSVAEQWAIICATSILPH
jgi:hypothetical protein